ncbi:MAG: hypothetical protein A2428_11760 [Bdellovibrionales bacterium RIFOXYC1_FULL_54_43]|nr:MAG: hypothetical protein A2428_11760 [Bdellovibrionales bacterium RIFOXYC1_FULL_54_43]OFZ81733.1 MAG: hypothetical protein A2603_09680 [Bdellovibrionales bacterium RIFOXYD1_FULL_55_31]
MAYFAWIQLFLVQVFGTGRLLAALLVASFFSPSLGLIPPSIAAEAKRQKVIDFEDEVVEGMNKRPLDSLSHLSEAEKRRRKHHLYRKRGGFRSETAETLRLLRYLP